MKRYFLLVMLLIPLFSACQSAQPSSTETILFLEFVTNVHGTSTAGDGCPKLGPLGEMSYKYSDNRLRSYIPLDIPKSHIFLACKKTLNDDIGSGKEGTLFAVQELPFSPAAPDYCQKIVIQSINKSGEVSLIMNGKEYGVIAGFSMMGYETDDSTQGCHITISYRLSNYGFLKVNQIRLPAK